MQNLIILHGRLGRDPKLETKNGKKSTYKSVNFSLAVDRDFGDETDWFYCVLNGSRADVIDKFFHKGSQILVTGHLYKYKSQDDPDHEKCYVAMTDFDFCDKASTANSNASTSQAKASTDEHGDSFEAIDDDVPF